VQIADWFAESESLYDWLFTANQFVLAPSLLSNRARFFELNTCGHSPYVTSSLTGGLVCRLQLLMNLASTFILRSECYRPQDHILLSQIRDSANLEGQVTVFMSPSDRVAQLYPRHCVPFPSPSTPRRAAVDVIQTSLHNLKGQSVMSWRINSRRTECKIPPTTLPLLFAFVFVAAQAWTGRVDSHTTTDCRSVSQSRNKAAIWGSRHHCRTVAGLFMWGAKSEEGTGPSLTTFAGPRQSSHPRVLVPWAWRSHPTVSDPRLPPAPKTRRTTTQAPDPPPTRDQ
jgi:hypothetical protein